ncbi:glycolipid transfer protein-like [Pocillopora verrucosa]|uniref:glycolipid transfer protein-like n=1 Tax=Pocillopora verrucosa TaxID=203993 RepID=UPI00279792EB|nr:glycolipid transfer protein-like [Pocillopora verrucosa]
MSFFTEAEHKFLSIPEDIRIETKSFLDAASEVVPFFDVLGPTAFAPVKSDINGNIKKLREKFTKDLEKFKTLQDIVESEMAENSTKAKNSATDALLWLKRALRFIIVFLREVLTGEEDLVKCAKKAYENSLKRFHGWMVQGVFSLALKAVPYRKDFIDKLGRNKVDEDTVLREMREFVDLLEANLEVVEQFYQKNNLETSQVQ